MYGTDPTSSHFLYTHDEPITQPIPVLSVAGPIRPSQPHDSVAEVYSGAYPDAELNSRSMMWILLVAGILCPLFGALSGGFLGFFVGVILSILLALAASYVRYQRVKAIHNGRTDLEFSPAEVKTENAMAIAVAIFFSIKALSWMEHRHARHIAEEISKINGQ